MIISCSLDEPNGEKNDVLTIDDITLSFNGSTRPIFLARSGEYVLAVSLYRVAGSIGEGPGFNRRLISLKAFSKDDAVATAGMALVTSILVFIAGSLISKLG